MVEITSKTAVWYSTGLFAVPLRWILVRNALAAGSNLPGDASAPGTRDAEAVVGFGHKEDHPGTIGAVLCGHFVCAWPDGTGSWRLSVGGLVPQGSSDLRRCAGLGTQTVVGSGAFYGSSANTETVKVPRTFM